MSAEELKLHIKKWEILFAAEHGRKPDKDDIKVAPESIKVMYREYRSLKKNSKNSSQSAVDEEAKVWGEEFNKANQNSRSKKQSSDVLEKITKKLEKNITKYPEPYPLKVSSVKLQPLNPKLEILCNEKVAETSEEVPSHTTQCSTVPDNACDFTAKNFKICTALSSYKPLKKINVLSPVYRQIKTLSFQHDFSQEWLDRCIKANDKVIQASFKNESSQDTGGQKMEIVHERQSKVLNGHEENCILSSVELLSQNNELQASAPVSSASPILQAEVCSAKRKRTASHRETCQEELHKSVNTENHTEKTTSTKKFNDTDYSNDSDSHAIKKSKMDCNECQEEPTQATEQKKKRKISSGTLNENFVRINIKKKKFSRGHHKVNIRKMKWQKWKQRKKSDLSSASASSTACFKCGETGHWARSCRLLTETSMLPLTEPDSNFPLPTLEEAAEMCKDSTSPVCTTPDTQNCSDCKGISAHGECETSTQDTSIACADENPKQHTYVPPLYENPCKELPSEIYECMKNLGYSEFRNGQEKAIMRILCGLSTLVVLPTGAGKSLCYQLPAYMYAQKHACITLVISPLVSLMEDQTSGLPSSLRAVCLHSGMTEVQKNHSLDAITKGEAHIVLLAPEVVTKSRNSVLSNLPPIAFACIDEAHCLSQWSHNFRPSYLQLCKVLKQELAVNCILGLTATATASTIADIIEHLGIKDKEFSIIGKTTIPSNLCLSISRDQYKDEALIHLLKSETFEKNLSVIIYCIRRDETERLAALIRTHLQDIELPAKLEGKSAKSRGRRLAWTAEAYHAGLTAAKRRSIQKRFMTGKLRVVVATVAFGMGLDKADVRAIIHYNMPKSFESYVQEIGRAGRDGQTAYCHLLLDNEGKDLWELQRHIHSNGVDRLSLKKLLQKVFVPCKCTKLKQLSNHHCDQENCEVNQCSLKDVCPKHEVAFTMHDTVQSLDLKEENILTLLCYLELHPSHWIELLPPTYSTCTIRCYGGPEKMRSLIRKLPALAVAVAMDKQRGKEWNNSAHYQFNVIPVASYVGLDSSVIKRELKELQWKDRKRTGVLVEFSDLAFHVRARGDLTSEEMDDVLDFLCNKCISQEKLELQSLEMMNKVFHKYAFESCNDSTLNYTNSNLIKEAVERYFETGNALDSELGNAENNDKDRPKSIISEAMEEDIRNNIRQLIYTNSDQKFTGRAIARIFHGVSSPCYPAEIWGRVKRFWRSYLGTDFSLILKMANEELIKMK